MMRFLFFALIILSFTIIRAQESKEITFSKGENSFTVESVDQEGFSVHLSIAKGLIYNYEIKGTEFSVLQAKGFTKSSKYGNPDLPVKSKLFEIPYGADVKINILNKEDVTIDLKSSGIESHIMPCQPSVAKCGKSEDKELIFNKELYQTNEFYGNQLVVFEEVGVMRGTRLGRIEINPFQYNPVTNQLMVATELEIEVVFDGADFNKTQQMKTRYDNIYFNPLLSKTLNHIDGAKPLNQFEPIKMLIISDRMFETSLAPFVAWKNKTGIETTVRYTDEAEVGSSTTTIQAFLQGVYDAATVEDPAPTFVLLVGDVAQIPAFTGVSNSGHVTDLYYFCYDGGSDNIPDVNYGRFSAQSTTDLDNIIEKTLLYEQYQMSDPSYLDQTILVAGNDENYEDIFGNGAVRYIDDYYFNEAHGLTSHLFLQDPPISNGAYSDSIIANVNSGIAWGNYTAHCSSSGWGTPSFTTSDVPSLTNTEKYGVLIGNCCLSNKFDDSECFGESLLRAEDKGAIGYIGGSNSTYWDEDYYWAVGNGSAVEYPDYEDFGNGCYDLMFHENSTDQPYVDWALAQSQVNLAGQLAVEESSSTRKLYYWEIYHLMGDPSLMPYVGVPDAMSPNYSSSIQIGVGTLNLSNLPAYARVALSENGTLKTVSVADASGNATLTFEAFSGVTTADVVITAQFYQPFVGTLDVMPANEPYVSLNGVSSGEIAGNGDDQVDYNESIALSLNLKNVAASGSGNDAAGVSAVLSTTDTYISITDNSESYGTIVAGDSITIASGFSFDVADDVPDQHSVGFTLTITGTDAKYTWESSFNITINAPDLSLGEISIDDSGSGNGDGFLDPGETANINLPVINNGSSDAVNIVSTYEITTGNEYMSFAQYVDSILLISGGGQVNAVFEVTAEASAPVGSTVDLSNNTTCGIGNQYNATTSQQIEIGFIPEYCTSGATSSSDTEIDEVAFGDVVNNTANSNGTYSDFTENASLTDEFMLGESFNISVTVGTSGGDYNKAAKVYIDWNYDGDFTDDNEMVFETGVANGTETFSSTIDVPADISTGQKFMRVVCSENETNINPCGTFTYGETEDYKIGIIAPLTPVAAFSANRTEITTGMTVGFTDESQNSPTEWIWAVSPGVVNTDYSYVESTSATSQNPVIEFNTAGSYSVSLTSTNITGSDTETKSNYVLVSAITDIPTANFESDVTNIDPGEIVYFTDLSTNTPDAWAWSVSPGTEGVDYEFVESTSSSSQNPAIQFNTSGEYDVQLIASNVLGDSDPYNVTDAVTVNAVYNMQDGTITTCAGTLYDSGGPDGDYSNDENDTLTIYPGTAGAMIELDFISFSVEDNSYSGGCYDDLTIYDGENISATQIGAYCDGNPPTIITASNGAGALTLVFSSDGSVVQAGWEASILCYIAYTVTFNITDGSNPIEGAVINIDGSNLTTNASGVATIELENGVYNYSIAANGYAPETGTVSVNNSDVSEPVAMNAYTTITAGMSGIWSTVLGLTNEFTSIVVPNGIEITIPGTKETESCRNLTVNPGGMLTVEGSLLVHEDLLIEADASGYGSFINKGNVQVQDSVNIQLYLTENTQTYNWHYIASPVVNATAGTFPGVLSPTSGSQVYALSWDESNNIWNELNNTTDILNKLQGYAIPVDGALTVNFESDLLLSGLQTLTGLSYSSGDKAGYHLVGNPFTASMPSSAILGANWTEDIWIRCDGAFQCYNVAGGVGDFDYIPPMQAFWIKVNEGGAGEVTFNPNNLEHQPESIYKTSTNNQFFVELSDGDTSDKLIIYQHQLAQNEFDNFDTEKMFATDPDILQVYSSVSGRQLAITGLSSDFTDKVVIPIGFKSSNDGKYTLSVPDIANFNANYNLYLTDRYTGDLVDLRKQNEYTFETSGGQIDDRLIIKIVKSSTGVDALSNSLRIYGANNTVFIETSEPVEGELKIYDVSGNLIHFQKMNLSSGTNGTSFNHAPGIYIATFKSDIRLTKEKIVIQ